MNRKSSVNFFSGLVLSSTVFNIFGAGTAVAMKPAKLTDKNSVVGSNESTVLTEPKEPVNKNSINESSDSIEFKKGELYKVIEKTISEDDLNNLVFKLEEYGNAVKMLEESSDNSLRFLVMFHKLFDANLEKEKKEKLNEAIKRAWNNKLNECRKILKRVSCFKESGKSSEALLLEVLRFGVEGFDNYHITIPEAFNIQTLLYEIFGKNYILSDRFKIIIECALCRTNYVTVSALGSFYSIAFLKKKPEENVLNTLSIKNTKEVLEFLLRYFMVVYKERDVVKLKDPRFRVFVRSLEALSAISSPSVSNILKQKLIVPLNGGNVEGLVQGLKWFEENLESLFNEHSNKGSSCGDALGEGRLYNFIGKTISEKDISDLLDGFKNDSFENKSESELREKMNGKSLRFLVMAHKLGLSLKEEERQKIKKVIESLWKDKVEKCRQILEKVSCFKESGKSSEDLSLEVLRFDGNDFDNYHITIPEAFTLQTFLYEALGKKYVLSELRKEAREGFFSCDEVFFVSSLFSFYTFAFSKIGEKGIDKCLLQLSVTDRKEILEFMLLRFIKYYYYKTELENSESNKDPFLLDLNSLYLLSSRCNTLIAINLSKKLIVPMNKKDIDGLVQGLRWFSENLDSLLEDLKRERVFGEIKSFVCLPSLNTEYCRPK